MQVFDREDINYFYSQPEVLSAREKSGVVSFQVESNDSIRAAIHSHGINAGRKIPMRWIEGDTEEHIDQGRENFEKTFLVYLEGSGNFIVGTETHSIGENTGFIFNEGIAHRTEGASKRLLVGPMNEYGHAVGAPYPYIVGTYTLDFLFDSFSEPTLSVYACSATEAGQLSPTFGVQAQETDHINFNLVCSFTGLKSFTQYSITKYHFSVTEELISEFTYNPVRTLPCFGGPPRIPILFYSQTTFSSWSSDVSPALGLADAFYGFNRYDENGFIDENQLLSISNSISYGYGDLFQFSITAFATNSCGFTESAPFVFDNCIDVGGSYSTFTYFASTNLGFSYSVDISGITGANVVYSYSENIGSEPVKSGNSLSGFVLFTDIELGDIAIMATNCSPEPVYSDFITGQLTTPSSSKAFVVVVILVAALFLIGTLVFAYNAYAGTL